MRSLLITSLLTIIVATALAQSKKDTDWMNQYLVAVYAFDWEKSEKLKKEIASNPQMQQMATAFEWRWRYQPIHLQEVKFNEYILLLEQVSKNKNSNASISEFWETLANVYIAEAYYNNGDQLKAFSIGKKLLSYLEKLSVSEKEPSELLLLKGIYLYYMEYAAEQYPVLGSMVNWWYKGDKAKGLEYIKIVAESTNFTNVEAMIYYTHIQTKLENQAEKSLKFAATLVEHYPQNPKFYELYIENLLLCKQNQKAKQVNTAFAAFEQPYYRMKQRYHQAYLQEKEGLLKEAEKSYFEALVQIELAAGQNQHMKSLVYAGLARMAKLAANEAEYKKYQALAEKNKVYTYPLSDLS